MDAKARRQTDVSCLPSKTSGRNAACLGLLVGARILVRFEDKSDYKLGFAQLGGESAKALGRFRPRRSF
jgi:hypothetical protein